MAGVLIIDDDADIRALLTAFVLAEDHLASSAASGNEALLLIDALQPDLILLDAVMPGLDGFETCRGSRSAKAPRISP